LIAVDVVLVEQQYSRCGDSAMTVVQKDVALLVAADARVLVVEPPAAWFECGDKWCDGNSSGGEVVGKCL
jgi:tagatose-1,6-bisphosphate aldolase